MPNITQCRPAILNIAHRGARAFAPENTLEAIAMAAKAGADAVEIDVQSCADGTLVVAHDADLLRCSNARQRFPGRAPWAVSAFSAAELHCLDMGSWFAAQCCLPAPGRQAFLASLTPAEAVHWITPGALAHYGSGQVRMPDLDACLAACDGLRLGVHIELKAGGRDAPDLVRKTIAAIDRHRMRSAVVVSSFDHPQLARVRVLADDIRTAVLSDAPLHRPVEYLKRLGAQAYHPGCDERPGLAGAAASGAVPGNPDPAMVCTLRRAGYDVNVWTVNDPARMEQLLAMGVTGIFTDYPNRLTSLLDGCGARAER